MTLRVLAWPGMPARASLVEAAHRLGHDVSLEVVASNEVLEEQMHTPSAPLDDPAPSSDRVADASRDDLMSPSEHSSTHDARAPFDIDVPTSECSSGRASRVTPYDLVFPSDYLVERLAADGAITELDHQQLPLERIAPWARDGAYDPGCRHSIPFAFGTTGYLTADGTAPPTWATLLDPAPGARVGMLDEVREVVGAALIASGHDPNEVSETALAEAEALLERQRPAVARYDSDDFVTPVVTGAVTLHHAWSGPAAHAVRSHPELRYVVPEEGAILWVTTAAIPTDAPNPDLSTRLIAELMDPHLAAQTTVENGFATPNEAARALLPPELATDPFLFPNDATLARCHTLRDLGPDTDRFIATWQHAP